MLAPLVAGSEFGLRADQVLASLVMVAALWAAGAQRASVLLFAPAIIAHLLDSFWGMRASVRKAPIGNGRGES